MANLSGHINLCPQKLVTGMKVVVKFKPGVHILNYELAAGASSEVWFKAELGLLFFSTSGGQLYPITYNGVTSYVTKHTATIIRSTARQDNLTPSDIRTALKLAANRQRKGIMASVKVVRQKIY